MTSRETLAARETPIAITLRGQFAFRISGTPVALAKFSWPAKFSSFLRAYVRIKRMLNEFVAQNRVSVVRNGVQSSIRGTRRVFSLSPSSVRPPPFLFLDTLTRSTHPTLSPYALFLASANSSTPALICTRRRITRVFGMCVCVCAQVSEYMNNIVDANSHGILNIYTRCRYFSLFSPWLRESVTSLTSPNFT